MAIVAGPRRLKMLVDNLRVGLQSSLRFFKLSTTGALALFTGCRRRAIRFLMSNAPLVPAMRAPFDPDIWAKCVDALAQHIPEQQFNTWIRPLVATVTTDPLKITLQVANRFKMDWVRSQYAQKITQTLKALCGEDVVLELALTPRESDTKSAPVAPRIARDSVFDEAIDAPSLAPLDSTNTDSAHKSRLNTALTFESLVEGSANRMARAAAMHVASQLGQLYNPLFIYGGVGLGKTHLMHAIGNHLVADQPNAKVLYIHAEQFVSDVVKAYQRKAFDEFKARYHSLDLLLIDDVQFFANKDRTQEEFFNAFEALLTKRSHIVMTSDTYPKGLSDIHERLVSRFDSGLTVAIEPPEF